MTILQYVRRSALLVTAWAIVAGTAAAQKTADEWLERCRDNWGDDRRMAHCEVKEQLLPATSGTLSVDGGQNGGIAVYAWERDSVLVRAKIQGWGGTEEEARRVTGAVRLATDGRVRAEGPSRTRDSSWGASFDVFVPRRANLSLETNNGGIRIENVHGTIDFDARNGGITLTGVGGNVRGRTTNGGLDIELTGTRWEGEQLDVVTTNGGIHMSVPENYSARLETGTTNGPLSIDFPVTVQGNIGRRIVTTLGSGGPLVRVITTNGGVKIRKR